MPSNEETARAHRNIILCQCMGLLAGQSFSNGFLINYIKKFDVSDGATLFILTFIPNIAVLILTLPLAHISDRKGMKKIGNFGNWLQVVGFGFLTLVYFAPAQAVLIFFVSIIIFSIGGTLFQSNWFALIDPHIDPARRGQFFSKLRISWQLVAIAMTFAVTVLLGFSESKSMYLGIIIFLTIISAIRILFYKKIPELSKIKGVGNMRQSWGKLRENKLYMRFCLYVFCMTFLTCVLLPVFNLYEKGILGFSEPQIVIMGFLGQLGALAGFRAGAYVVDKRSHEALFNLNNGVKLLIVLIFVFIRLIPVPPIITAGLLTFLVVFIGCAAGIGTTAEAMKRVEPGEKSFGIGLSFTMGAAGGVAASFISSLYFKFFGDLHFSVGSWQLNHYEIFLCLVAFGYLLINVFFRFKKEAAL